MTRKFARDERVYQKIATWNLVKGDKVEVIEGKDRGKQGTIIEVVRGKNAVVVGGIKVHPRMRRKYVVSVSSPSMFPRSNPCLLRMQY